MQNSVLLYCASITDKQVHAVIIFLYRWALFPSFIKNFSLELFSKKTRTHRFELKPIKSIK